MTPQFYNTLTRRKDPLAPLDPNHVTMYVCGPTVYDSPHLGNARSVVVYDVLYRLLKQLYPRVTYVRNITDVDDKINAAATLRGISIQLLTSEVTAGFHADMDALNVLRPTIEPRATEHIPQMIAMIEKLIANGNAYVSQNHVLFDVTSHPNAQSPMPNPWHYGLLSGRVQEELKAGARIEVEGYKRHASDFVLWKPVDAQDDPSSIFDSPWGKGRPGWHIECSAMSTHYLGQNFDIHGGGADLMFPHHENEIAQSCCAAPGSEFAKLWVHNGFLTVNGEKMSKSLGNFITVRELLEKGVKGEVIRFALLSTGYNKPLDWNDKLLEDAKKSVDRLYRAEAVPGGSIDPEVIAALSDDLNLPRALAQLHTLTHDPATLKATAQFLGFLQQDAEEWFKGAHSDGDAGIQVLVEARLAAKKAKNWAEADRIRKELSEQGITLEDRPDGTTDWRRG